MRFYVCLLDKTWWSSECHNLIPVSFFFFFFNPDGPLPDPTLIRANVPNQMMNRMQAQPGKYLKKISYCDFEGILELGNSC